MKIFSKGLGFVEFNNQVMNWVKFNGQLVYEAFKKLLASGIPPLTLLKSKGVDLVDYKIYGESVQGKLPSDYQQVEYIESTGTQYINTGVIANQDIGFDITFLSKNQISNTSSEYGCILGSRESSQVNDFQLTTYISVDSDNQGSLRFGTDITVNAGISVNEKVSVSLRNKIYSNGSDIQHNFNNDFTTPGNLFVFSLNNNGAPAQSGKVQIYSLKLYNKDTLIRDFIPCYRVSDNVIGMYDSVNNVFYRNAGSGTFLKGNDLPTPDTPIEIESVGEKTKNLWGEETTVISSTTGLSYKWDNYGCYVTNTGTITKGVGFTMKLPAGNYSIYCKDFRLYINKNGSLVVVDKKFSTINGTEEFEIKLRSFLSSGSTAYYKISVIEGTYTEDTMPEYEPYGYKIPVRMRGKNFFNIDNIAETSAIKKNEDGSITVSGYPASTTKKLRELCPELQVGQTIIFSMITNGYSQIYLNNLTTGKNTYWNNKNSYVITEDLLGSSVYFYRQTSAQGGGPATISNIQIELGDTLTDHEPYVEPITTNIYLKEPLRKIDDYKDYIDFEKQQVVRKIYHEFLDTVTTVSSDSTVYKKFLTDITKKPLIIGVNTLTSRGFALSNKFKKSNYQYTNLGSSPNFTQTYITTTGINRVAYTLDDKSITTVEQAQEKIGDGFDIYYVLAGLIEEDIDLPSIPTHKGTTVIEVDTNIKPSNMEVAYLGKK